MKSYERKLVLVGLYTLALSAILGMIAVLIAGELPPLQQSAQWAERVSSAAYTISQYILIYAYLIGILGFWAIHRLFSADKTSYLLSFWGMILSILGSALPMAAIGVYTFAHPALARMSLNQALDVVTLTKDMFNPGAMVFLLFSGMYYLAGIILFGIVMWKNAAPLLRIASISIIIHSFLIILPDQMYINLSSWVLLLASSVLLIVYARRLHGET